MPALSSTMKEGKVVQWTKNVGDKVPPPCLSVCVCVCVCVCVGVCACVCARARNVWTPQNGINATSFNKGGPGLPPPSNVASSPLTVSFVLLITLGLELSETKVCEP